jgi:hypothetical protein
MRRHALQQRQRIADPVGRVGCQRRGRQGWIDGHDLLEQRRYRPEAVPEVRGELGEVLALLAELEQRVLPRLRID